MTPRNSDPIRGATPLAARVPSRPGLRPARIMAALCFAVPIAMALHIVLPLAAGRPDFAGFGPHSIYPAVVALLIGGVLSLCVLRAR